MDTHLLSHIIPVLGRVDPGFQRRRPAGCVHGRASMGLAFDRLPIDEERDGVLCLGHAVVWLARGDSGGSAGYNARGYSEVL